MKFSIDLKGEDLEKFNVFTLKDVSKGKMIYWSNQIYSFLFWMLVVFTGLQIKNIYDKEYCYKDFNLDAISVSLFVLLLSGLAFKKISTNLYMKNMADQNGTILGRWDITIEDNGILEKNDKCHSFFSWQAVQKIEKDDSNLYLFTDKIKAIILPLSQINEDIESEINKNVTPI